MCLRLNKSVSGQAQYGGPTSALKLTSERASREDNMKKELIKFVINHLKTFKAYPLEFEYKNKVYNYKTIIKIINNRKQQASEQKG